MKYWWIILAVIVAAYVLGYVNGCRSVHCPENNPVVQANPKEIPPVSPILKAHDSVPAPKIILAKKRRLHPSFSKAPVPNLDPTFDTPICDELLTAYYTSKYYTNDYIDSAMTITVEDSVTENRLTWRKVQYLNHAPSVTHVIERRQSFAVAGNIGFNTLSGPSLGGDIEWKRLRVMANYYPVTRSYSGKVGYVLFRR